jgi:hypothetical protein
VSSAIDLNPNRGARECELQRAVDFGCIGTSNGSLASRGSNHRHEINAPQLLSMKFMACTRGPADRATDQSCGIEYRTAVLNN